MNSVLAILIGLMSGAAMSVAVSSVWCVLHLPARIQHLLHAASPRMMGLALLSGLMLAALHNALGDNAYVAAMQGAPNDETQFLLDRFGFQAPTLLTNVRTQVRDIDYDRPPTLGTSVPISHAWAVLREDENLSAVPVTNEDGTLYGMLTAGGIAEKDMESITKPEVRDVPIFNLLSALEGHIINNEEDTFDTISGEVVIALPTPGECLKGVNSGSIVINKMVAFFTFCVGVQIVVTGIAKLFNLHV